MSVRHMLVLLFVFTLSAFQGGAVYAVDVYVEIQPEKGTHAPGEPVRLAVSAQGGTRIRARIFYLAEPLTTIEAEVSDGNASIVWTPPAEAPRGYGVEVELLDAAGDVLARTSTAFDVLDHWTQAPRYGFLTEFTDQRADPDETMRWAARYHLNALQFYDWQYRHEQLLPPAGSDRYSDLLGREMSLEVVKALISAARARGIAAMPYTAIYGASPDFYQQHPDWALFSAPGKPYLFGAGYLMIMNPAPDTPWTQYLLDQYAQVLDQTGFDGIHIDQYGAPMRGLDSDNRLVKLEDAFPAFIDATADLVDAKRGERGAVIFNLVRNWPLVTVAPSRQDAVYIEVWEPYRDLLDLYRIIAQAQTLSGGKPVILAAYIPPKHEVNVRLASALIFASGGAHIELGEPNTMLADPYFPKFGVMDAHMQEVMRRHYDFAVRYENLLALDTRDATAERAHAVRLEGIPTAGTRARDRVVTIVRAGARTETFSLINLIGIDGERWDAPITQAPTPQRDINVSIQVERPVVRLYAASPDNNLSLQALPFTLSDGQISFVVPHLSYWTMIVVEYAE